ncbi:hypothetical protein [Ornithinimicrobium kibberense]|uniref:hypothetical protein n=1 Tax=Ornithinimicrobium kibberense TaxID=282060 RepID=UPI00361C64A3
MGVEAVEVVIGSRFRGSGGGGARVPQEAGGHSGSGRCSRGSTATPRKSRVR